MILRRWLITMAVCLGMLICLTLFKVLEIRSAIAFAESFPEQSETVEAAQAVPTKYAPRITVTGEVLAPKRLDLRNELPGEIAQVNFESGEKVAVNQLLLQLDVSIEKANLSAAMARSELALSTFKRAESLLRSDATSKELFDRTKADLALAKAEIAVLERTIAIKTIVAPFSATTGLHQFEVGQFLPANSFITTLVGDTDHFWIDFKVPQFYAPLTTGAEVRVKLIGSSDEAAAKIATVIAENAVIDSTSRSRSYRAKIMKNTDTQLKANSVVSIDLPTSETKRAFEIPATAVQYDTSGAFVYVLKTDANTKGYRASKVQVKLERTQGNTAYISGNIPEDQLIATSGSFKLFEDLLVFVRTMPDKEAIAQEINANPEQGSL